MAIARFEDLRLDAGDPARLADPEGNEFCAFTE
jgi:hypothetical protein